MPRRKPLTEEEMLAILEEEYEDLDNVETVNGPGNEECEELLDSCSDEEEIVHEHTAKRHRKVLTRDRIVNNLVESLDENNYNLLDPSERKTLKCVLEKGTKKKKEESITWCNIKEKSDGRQCAENILHTAPGPKNGAHNASSPIECWELFMTSDMIESIVTCTNLEINRKLEKIDLNKIEPANKKHLRTTTSEEMRAFIGLLYARGLLSLSHHSWKYLFQDAIGHPIFGATMSSNRFWFINSNIRFDDSDTRSDRFEHDRFAAFRDFYEMFNERCSAVLQPDAYLALDETLYGCKNQIAFRQYNSSKPQKYGLLFKSINAVQYPYTFRSVVYSGKPVGEPGPYYIPGIMPIVQSLITKLSENVDMRGRNITMDRLYTSYELLRWMLDQQITAVGTIKANKKCIPTEMKGIAGRDDKSYEYYWDTKDEKISLHSYVVNTKSSGKKNVLALSSVPPIIGVTKDDSKQKPAILKFYDFSKGGTDVMDQRMGTYTTNSMSPRWIMTSFSYVLDTIRVNAQTILALNTGINPRDGNSFKFGWDLAIELVTPYIKTRKALGSQSEKTRMKMQFILNESETCNDEQPLPQDLFPFPSITEQKKRCASCIAFLRGKPGNHKSVSTLLSMKKKCQACGNPTCDQHSVYVCKKCSSKLYNKKNERNHNMV